MLGEQFYSSLCVTMMFTSRIISIFCILMSRMVDYSLYTAHMGWFIYIYIIYYYLFIIIYIYTPTQLGKTKHTIYVNQHGQKNFLFLYTRGQCVTSPLVPSYCLTTSHTSEMNPPRWNIWEWLGKIQSQSSIKKKKKKG